MATLEKELSATSVQKITKPVKPPHVKPPEAKMVAEKAVSPFPFGEGAEIYKSRYDIETKRETGVRMVREEHIELMREAEAKVCH